jgi:HSP20 family protein
MTEKDIEVKVEENLLTVSAKKEADKEEKKNGYVLRERKSSSFSRSFVLPKEVNRDAIKAEFKNGLLTLTMEKTPKAQPKMIEVKEA